MNLKSRELLQVSLFVLTYIDKVCMAEVAEEE
jgi:hypothetical protein